MTQRQPSENNGDSNQEVARRLLERYSWQLTTPAELVGRSLALSSSDAGNFTKALVGAYCTILYQAFIGEQGPERQHRACVELSQVIASLVAMNYPNLPIDEREDITQNTLERVWRARKNCREPIAFLAFAASHLLSATQLARRQLNRLGEPLKFSFADNHDSIEIPDVAPTPLDQILDQERLVDIVRFLAELRRAHPRANNQIDILELHLLKDIDHAEIARRLKISPETVYTKLSRIRRTIQENPELSQRARDLGVT